MKQRNILLWYVILIVTLGLAGILWYYELNADAKRLAKNKAWSPGLSVLAITLGSLLIVPVFVSMWRTWSRIREATGLDGLSAGLAGPTRAPEARRPARGGSSRSEEPGS